MSSVVQGERKAEYLEFYWAAAHTRNTSWIVMQSYALFCIDANKSAKIRLFWTPIFALILHENISTTKRPVYY